MERQTDWADGGLDSQNTSRPRERAWIIGKMDRQKEGGRQIVIREERKMDRERQTDRKASDMSAMASIVFVEGLLGFLCLLTTAHQALEQSCGKHAPLGLTHS